MQPQLKTAGFDMKIKNTNARQPVRQMLLDGNYQVALLSPAAHRRSTPGPVHHPVHEEHPGPTNDNSGNNWSFASVPDGRPADARSSTPASTTTRARRPRKKADDILADDKVALPLDPLPDILIWSKKVVGPIGDNPIEGMFWNIDQWGVKQ